MSEKMKKLLMRQAYMGATALVIFIVIFVLCSIFPSVKEGVLQTLTKDTDLKKVASLFGKIAKEIIPF